MSKFVEIAKKMEELSEQMNVLREELKAEMTALGLNAYVQDAETSTVYKIVKPTGSFVYYKDIDYVRTALPGERAGTLSKKEAVAAGFTLKAD